MYIFFILFGGEKKWTNIAATYYSNCVILCIPFNLVITARLQKRKLSSVETANKQAALFQEVLDIARLLLLELGQHNDCEIEEKKSKLEQLKVVLEM